MAGQFISDASGYEATEFNTKIPSLSDQADIVEAFKLYHYGLDNYTGGESPSENSMHGHLESINGRLTIVENNPSIILFGTDDQITVSGSVGNVTVGLPDSVIISQDLTVSHNVTVGGNLVVSGSTTFVNTESLSVSDPIILLATDNVDNTLDIGLSGKYVQSASTLYTGFVKDESDLTWKLFSNVSSSPTTQVDFSNATFDKLKIGSLEVMGGIKTNSASDIIYTFNQKSTSYTIELSDTGKIVEMNVGSANTVTVPLNTSYDFPIGSQVVILQTGSGQTTLQGAVGVSVNGSPGLKLRGQWASVTLIKRSTNSWVAIGDLVS
jgi:hypothetical protein